MAISRRQFVKSSGLVSLGFMGLTHLAAKAAVIPLQAYGTLAVGYGPLGNNANGILNLPSGFSCKVISQKGETMSDQLITPGYFDGMGAFENTPGKVALIRNHELSPGSTLGPYGTDNSLVNKVDKNLIYDYGQGTQICMGGTTTLLYDENTQRVEKQFLSLAGTIRNCAGGITPWKSWITCEETGLKANDKVNPHDSIGVLEKDHGYNFEVPAAANGLTQPIPLKAMGRFVHEAVAVQPVTGIVYQTEDMADGLFYRFKPKKYGQLQQGGKLQCLSLRDWKSADTRNWPDLSTDKFPIKKSFAVEWLDLDEVEAPNNDLRLRGFQQGGARFANMEGIWYGKEEVFFACTSGGENAKGQIFRYEPSKYEGHPREQEEPGKLELFLEPNNFEIFQKCDNLTISPWGDVIICEDISNPRILGITPKGEVYVIAQNIGYPDSEFAGPVFSPSGKTLFINIQNPGLTIAITGPWKSPA
ncbi:alkaline phosphatase PhoX [Adhaeribacter aquaticus]|uniref:alkaline phosphatase PhoX n=1 Tax=Adhaeribacter aquaticus TaxID=299567 RepID=UPI000556480D|nr:alkaline phosphatase PhoX [Adhaeribacter aquaticus]